MAFPSLATWVYFIWLAQSATAIQQGAMAVGKTVQFAFPILWVLTVQRRRVFPRPLGTRGVVEGAAFGASVGAAMLVVYHLWLKPAGFLAVAETAVARKLAGLAVDSLWEFVALGTFYSLVHSFLEEYYWRWFVYGQMRQWLPVPAAIPVASAGFMAHHALVLGFYFGWFSPVTALFCLAVGIGGAFWAWLYQRSGFLLGPWMSHLLVDGAIFVVGYDLARPLFH